MGFLEYAGHPVKFVCQFFDLIVSPDVQTISKVSPFKVFNALIEFIDRFYDLPAGVDTGERKKGYQGSPEYRYARKKGINRRVGLFRALSCEDIPFFPVEPAVLRYKGGAYRRKSYDGTTSAMGVVFDHTPSWLGLRNHCNKVGAHQVAAEREYGAHDDRS